MTTYPPAWPWMANLKRSDLELLRLDLVAVAMESDLDAAMVKLSHVAHDWAVLVAAAGNLDAQAELVRMQVERLVDAQGAPHHGCCPDHDWRGPGRDTSAQACDDLAQHEAETHNKEADRG